jgi:hypothetical protein
MGRIPKAVKAKALLKLRGVIEDADDDSTKSSMTESLPTSSSPSPSDYEISSTFSSECGLFNFHRSSRLTNFSIESILATSNAVSKSSSLILDTSFIQNSERDDSLCNHLIRISNKRFSDLNEKIFGLVNRVNNDRQSFATKKNNNTINNNELPMSRVYNKMFVAYTKSIIKLAEYLQQLPGLNEISGEDFAAMFHVHSFCLFMVRPS